ncbi:hypothetical protein [Alteromonas gracilis]|uniref:hypothetical protein n=1 Tax=Alteromonas gracilis TaxID=1479524 RepID=UPI00321A5B8F
MKASSTVLTAGILSALITSNCFASDTAKLQTQAQASLHKACSKVEQESLTLISTIQGDNGTSQAQAKRHTVRAIITGKRNSGFFIQEEFSDSDNNPATSEGILVIGQTDMPIGHKVVVSGTVNEIEDMTVFMPDSDVISCGKSEAISPALITIPFEVDLESLEGMLVSIEHATVTSTANLWREGEIVVSDAIKRQPSDIAAPFTSPYLQAIERAKENLLIVEDNSDEQNPALLSFYPEYGYNQSIRIGDTLSASGPLLHKNGTYSTQPCYTSIYRFHPQWCTQCNRR